MRRVITFIILIGLWQSARAADEARPNRPVPAIEQALIVSIDGLRPDVLLRTRSPRIHDLYEHGSFSFWARTTALSTTLPSHTSMLTGLIPRRHEVEWNWDLPLAKPVYPRGQTLFEVAKKAGYSTAMAAGKSKFTILAKPGTIDWMWVPETVQCEDNDVTEQAVQMILQHQPQVMFVHLPSNDNVGHAIGWGTPQQLAVVENADACVGRLLDAMQESDVLRHTFVLITADHGGAGAWHTPDDPRSRHIPWIATGPGIRQNLDLTTFDKLTINTEDTFATVCHLLAITYDRTIDGHPVTQIEERDELLRADK
ncbi:MAG TPA: alkaline phosphatase family protein [Humisphaera sp.]|jgi:predicted AlkP superfamily pyrophosphatase or phosphodiesterase|nr:alkaline phosphatase family protein [Humisphaera sp.]